MQHLLEDSEISEQQNSFFKPPLGVNVTRKPKTQYLLAGIWSVRANIRGSRFLCRIGVDREIGQVQQWRLNFEGFLLYSIYLYIYMI